MREAILQRRHQRAAELVALMMLIRMGAGIRVTAPVPAASPAAPIPTKKAVPQA